MRGLDAWISRGHERLDDVPEDDPNEQSLLTMVEDEIERELSAAAATNAVLFALERIRQKQDEDTGAALAARFDKETA